MTFRFAFRVVNRLFSTALTSRYDPVVEGALAGITYRVRNRNDPDTRPNNFVHVFCGFGPRSANRRYQRVYIWKNISNDHNDHVIIGGTLTRLGENRHTSGTLLFYMCITHMARVTVKCLTFTLALINNNE